MSGSYDLHAHTTASDGTFTPRELVEYAMQKGLAGVGVTDHDTTAGVDEALFYGKEMGIEIIPGVEINTEYEGKEVHVLGYFFDRTSQSLQNLFKTLRDERMIRMEKILEQLHRLQISISRSEVMEAAGDGAVGRPHIARILVKKGIVKDVREAFDEYLAMGKKAYVERFKLTPADAIQRILQAGGVPVLAHPGLVGKDALIEEMIPAGLLGIEVFHPDHSEDLRDRYARFADRLHLIATGGSDFHGAGGEHRADLGTVTVEAFVVQQLKQKSKQF